MNDDAAAAAAVVASRQPRFDICCLLDILNYHTSFAISAYGRTQK